MLTIRKEQMEAMHQEMLKRSHHSLQVHLRQRYPEQTTEMDHEQLSRLVITGIDKEKNYNITNSYDIKRFLEYQVEYGTDFGRAAKTQWAGIFLNNNPLSGTTKMDGIDNYALFVIKRGN